MSNKALVPLGLIAAAGVMGSLAGGQANKRISTGRGMGRRGGQYDKEYRRRLATASAAALATAGHPLRFPLLTPFSDRQTLIEWLEKNDPNGTYDDEESLAEFGEVMTLDEAWEIIEQQTEDYAPDAAASVMGSMVPGGRANRRERDAMSALANSKGRTVEFLAWPYQGETRKVKSVRVMYGNSLQLTLDRPLPKASTNLFNVSPDNVFDLLLQ
jgi:hypothetical protein